MKKIIFSAIILVILISHLNAQVAVIAHKSVKASSLNGKTVLSIWSLDKKAWEDGTKIKIFDLKSEGTTKSKFYSFIGQTQIELKKVWLRMQLAGEGKAPESFNSEEEILERVGSTTGAIGYISKSKVTDQVKVIANIP